MVDTDLGTRNTIASGIAHATHNITILVGGGAYDVTNTVAIFRFKGPGFLLYIYVITEGQFMNSPII